MLLGEVRCGTTTLASLLRSDLGMIGPFTPWDVPLANDKESFFFVGHYFGLVSPSLYRLCWPLRHIRWLVQLITRRRPPLLFDGCASHLSAPWAPRLIDRLQREEMGYSPHRSKGKGSTGGAATGPGKGGTATGHGANKSGMVFIVMVREPVSQHLSWWRLEQGSMVFAKEGLGMGEAYHREGGGGEEGRHTPPTTPTTAAADAAAAAAAAGLRKPMRIGAYPPASFEEAIELSRSKRVGELYKAAEALVAEAARVRARRRVVRVSCFPNHRHATKNTTTARVGAPLPKRPALRL